LFPDDILCIKDYKFWSGVYVPCFLVIISFAEPKKYKTYSLLSSSEIQVKRMTNKTKVAKGF
jgi:hypothetical protein